MDFRHVARKKGWVFPLGVRVIASFRRKVIIVVFIILYLVQVWRLISCNYLMRNARCSITYSVVCTFRELGRG
jgi:hypothetical protein